MFGKHHLFKLVAAIAVAVSMALVGAKMAKAGNPYNPSAYVYGGASPAVSQAIQSAGLGGDRSVAAARHQKALKVHASRLITDTLGGNGQSTVKVRSKVESIRLIPDTLGGDGAPQLPRSFGSRTLMQ